MVLRSTLVTEDHLDKLGQWLSDRKGTKYYHLHECEQLVDAANKFSLLVEKGVPVSRFAERMTGVPSERPKHIADVILKKKTNLNSEKRRENLAPKTLINFARAVYEIYYQVEEHEPLKLLMHSKSYNAHKQSIIRVLHSFGYDRINDDELGVIMEASLDEAIKVAHRSKSPYNTLTELADAHEWSYFRKIHGELQGNIDEKRAEGLKINATVGSGLFCSVDMKPDEGLKPY